MVGLCWSAGQLVGWPEEFDVISDEEVMDDDEVEAACWPSLLSLLSPVAGAKVALMERCL